MIKNARTHKRALNVEKTDIMDRDEILEVLGHLIREATVKVGTLRIKDVKTFKARLDGLKTLAYSLSIYKSIFADKQLDTIIDRVTALETGAK